MMGRPLYVEAEPSIMEGNGVLDLIVIKNRLIDLDQETSFQKKPKHPFPKLLCCF